MLTVPGLLGSNCYLPEDGLVGGRVFAVSPAVGVVEEDVLEQLLDHLLLDLPRVGLVLGVLHRPGEEPDLMQGSVQGDGLRDKLFMIIRRFIAL